MTFNEFRQALIEEMGEDEAKRVIMTISLSSKVMPYKPGAAVKRVMSRMGIKGATDLRVSIKTALNQY